jgi:hypothetical protein
MKKECRVRILYSRISASSSMGAAAGSALHLAWAQEKYQSFFYTIIRQQRKRRDFFQVLPGRAYTLANDCGKNARFSKKRFPGKMPVFEIPAGMVRICPYQEEYTQGQQ